DSLGVEASPEDVPVEVEDRLSRAGTDVDQHAVVAEAGGGGRGGDEVEHSPGLFGRELRDLAETVDVALGEHEEMRLRERVEIGDRDETLRLADVRPVCDEPAEEALVRQRGSPPR